MWSQAILHHHYNFPQELQAHLVSGSVHSLPIPLPHPRQWTGMSLVSQLSMGLMQGWKKHSNVDIQLQSVTLHQYTAEGPTHLTGLPAGQHTECGRLLPQFGTRLRCGPSLIVRVRDGTLSERSRPEPEMWSGN